MWDPKILDIKHSLRLGWLLTAAAARDRILTQDQATRHNRDPEWWCMDHLGQMGEVSIHNHKDVLSLMAAVEVATQTPTVSQRALHPDTTAQETETILAQVQDTDHDLDRLTANHMAHPQVQEDNTAVAASDTRMVDITIAPGMK